MDRNKSIKNSLNLFLFSLWSVVSIGQDITLSLINVDSIKTYDKVELGVHFPKELEQKIQNYVQNRVPISYKNSEPNFINPFDPEQLDVQVEFWQPNGDGRSKYYKRFAFYYDAFSVSGKEVRKVKTANTFRVRFSPQEQGEWNCKALVVVKEDSLFSDVFSFSVNQKGSSKGFMQICGNKQYFKVGDSSFFPVGQNIPWPGDIWYNDTKPLKHYEFEKYERLVRSFSERGGNYYRMLITPWTYDIEFENLGNYSSRMKNAWELDNLIAHSEELGIKIHFNMLLHGVLENPSVYTITNWDWPAYDSDVYGDKKCVSQQDKGFCYSRELELNHPVEFFTNTQAKRFYKNKLRYMIARWGYSTSIGLFELLSEINNLGQQARLEFNGKGCPNVRTVTAPYHDSVESVPKIVLEWQHEMGKYIKEDLKHENHPIAVSYTGEPAINNGDLSYYSPYIDIATYNAYSFDRNQNKYLRLTKKLTDYRKDRVVVSNSIIREDESKRSVSVDKPFMLSEIGSGLSECDNSTIWKQSVFLSPFTGLSGVAMPWLNYNDNDDLWKHFKFINSFMNQVDLSGGGWNTNANKSKSNLVEIYGLQNKKERLAIGVVNNRTYNYYTTRNDCVDCFCSKDTVSNELRILKTILSSEKENRLRLLKMGTSKKYMIAFYNPLNGKQIGEKLPIKTNWRGQLVFPYPDLIGKERPFVYFKIELGS